MKNKLKIKEKLKKSLEKDREYQPPYPPDYNELVDIIGKINYHKLFVVYGYLDMMYDSVAGYIYNLLENDKVNWDNKVLLDNKKETVRKIIVTKKALRKYFIKYPIIKKYFESLLTWWKRILIILNLLLEYEKSANKLREAHK